jgi:hypothetical protein
MTIRATITVDNNDLPALLDYLTKNNAEVAVTITGTEPTAPTKGGLSEEVADFLRRKTRPGTHRDVISKFLVGEVWAREAVLVPGTDNTDYIRLHVPGPRRVGAYAYVRLNSGGVDFRLPPERADDDQLHFTTHRNIAEGSSPYGIRTHLPIRPDDINAHPNYLPEAHMLAAEAASAALNT